MTSTEFCEKYPEFERYSYELEIVENNNPTTDLIISKGYLLRFYRPRQYTHFAAVTITLNIVPDAVSTPNISMHYPSDIDADKLLLISVIRIQEYRDRNLQQN